MHNLKKKCVFLQYNYSRLRKRYNDTGRPDFPDVTN